MAEAHLNLRLSLDFTIFTLLRKLFQCAVHAFGVTEIPCVSLRENVATSCVTSDFKTKPFSRTAGTHSFLESFTILTFPFFSIASCRKGKPSPDFSPFKMLRKKEETEIPPGGPHFLLHLKPLYFPIFLELDIAG